MTPNDVSDQIARMELTSTQEYEPPEYVTEWRGAFRNAEVNALHAECFEHQDSAVDWWAQVNRFSLGWVCTRRSGKLVGFVNVAWDGGVHAFILDTMVSPTFRRQGIAKALIVEAVDRVKQTDCEWLHVDFDPHLRTFYFDACKFRPTDAGLIALK
ncbi:GNAT family N-acetyltransferase [Rhizobium azibense]|uniref:GNAT family N-acetyltransferase n=1 Tax=Rhizobium azibense TaxID=1136135 RepID=UPI001FE09A50|nr:GNAT family N-acetyltransferase [Rhizobium azibense]